MSSDNGVYVLKTKAPSGEGYEFRVAHAQAIDDLYYDIDVDGGPWETFGAEPNQYSPDFFDLPANRIFGGCEVYTEEDQAWEAARTEADKHHVLEYGVSTLEHPNQAFKHMTEEEMAAEEARIESVLEGHRAKQQRELDELKCRKEEASIEVSDLWEMEVSNLWGFLVTPGGERIHGRILGKCTVTFPEPVKFLPSDWNKNGEPKE